MRLSTATTARLLARNIWVRVVIYIWLAFTIYLWWQGYSWLTVDQWYYRDQRIINQLNEQLVAGKKVAEELRAARQRLDTDNGQLRERVKAMRERRQLTVVTMVTGAEMARLPDFVGAVHRVSPDPNQPTVLIKVYGFGLTEAQVEQISTWRQTEYLDGTKALLADSQEFDTATKPFDQPALVLQAIATNLHHHPYVMYLRYDYVVTDGKKWMTVLDKLEANGVALGYEGELPSNDPAVKSNGIIVAPEYAKYQFLALMANSDMARLLIHEAIECAMCVTECDRDNMFSEQMDAIAKLKTDLNEFGVQAASRVKELKYFCQLRLQDDLLMSYALGHHGTSYRTQLEQLKTEGRHFKESTKDTVIGLGLLLGEVTSVTAKSLEQLPAVSQFLTSFVDSLTEDEREYFQFKIYLGYDATHVQSLFRDSESLIKLEQLMHAKIKAVNDQLAKQTGPTRMRSAPLEPAHLNPDGKIIHEVPYRSPSRIRYDLQLVRVPVAPGWTTFQWNALMTHAIKDAVHYFMQLDDGAFTIPPSTTNTQSTDNNNKKVGWVESLVHQLESMNDEGIVSPTFSSNNNNQKQNGRQPTMIQLPMVSRQHFRTFSGLYAHHIPDHYAKRWVVDIYRPDRTVAVEQVAFSRSINNAPSVNWHTCFDPDAYQQLIKTKQA